MPYAIPKSLGRHVADNELPVIGHSSYIVLSSSLEHDWKLDPSFQRQAWPPKPESFCEAPGVERQQHRSKAERVRLSSKSLVALYLLFLMESSFWLALSFKHPVFLQGIVTELGG